MHCLTLIFTQPCFVNFHNIFFHLVRSRTCASHSFSKRCTTLFTRCPITSTLTHFFLFPPFWSICTHTYISPASLEKSGSYVGLNHHGIEFWWVKKIRKRSQKIINNGQNKRWKGNLSFEIMFLGALNSFNLYSKGASSPSTCLVSWGCDFILFLRSLKCLQ